MGKQTLLIIVLMIATIIPAFAGGAQEEPQTAARIMPTEPGTFPVVTDPVTLRFFAPHSARIEDISTNTMTLMYEEKTNVRIEWELAPEVALNERRALSLASEDYPDVYFASRITRQEEMRYGPAGIFIGMNDLIADHTVYVSQMLADYPLIRQQIVAADGNIYSLPLARDVFHATFPHKLWINRAWLDRLSLEMPTTTEEYYDVLVAFRDRDPNNTGRNDTIPALSALPTSPYMNAFIYDDGDSRLIVDENHRVAAAFVQPGWRQGLEYMRKLYAEGLFDSAAFTMDRQQIIRLVESAEAERVGSVPAMGVSAFSNLAGERHRNYDPVPPLRGPDGVQYATHNPYTSGTGTFVITRANRYPEVTIRWVDWLYSWDGSLRAREGEEGVNWQRPAPGTISYTGGVATWERMAGYGATHNNRWDGIDFPQNMTIHGQQTGHEDIYLPTAQPTRLYQVARMYEPYAPPRVLPPLYIPVEQIEDYTRMKVEIETYVRESLVRFVTGDLDIERDWDSYLAVFPRLGLAEYLRIVQDAYDTFGAVHGR